MEKSIEEIWKAGFLDEDALIAPKINDLYNQKSQHIIAKFQRRFRLNIIIFVGSAVVALASYTASGAFYVGLFMFVVMGLMAWHSYKEAKNFRKIDQGVSSYEYLKAFDTWLKEILEVYTGIYRFMYAMFFLATVAGVWFSNFKERALEKLTLKYPTIFYSIDGVPVYLLTGVIIITVVLTYFGRQIYRWDVNLLYGRILRKLDTLIKDMEELREGD